MKKLFLLIICVVLSIGARAQFSGSGNGTEADPYRIYNEIHFAQMANFLNQEGVVFELMKDVDLSNYISENSPSQGWMPIGVESTPFKGVLKGNGHTISGLMINRPANNNIGLFGYMAGATVSDLTVKATSITGATNVGTLVGNVSVTTFTNCTVKVSAANGVKASDYLGGIAGRSSSCTFTNCDYEGNITATGNTGYAGGVVGYADTGSLSDCDVTGTVNAKAFCGGVAGSLIGVNLTNINMNGTVTGTSSIGGIVGIAQNSATWSDVNYYGDITGTENVAGGVGELSGASVTFNSVYTKGKITNTGDYTGGIVAKSNGGCIAGMESCSHFGDIVGKNCVGGIVGSIQGSEARPVYYGSSSSTSNTQSWGPSYGQIVNGVKKTISINNCCAIGNIAGIDDVGGLFGRCEAATTYSLKGTYASDASGTIGQRGQYWHLWRNSQNVDYNYYYYSPIDEENLTETLLQNCYYSGAIQGKKDIGGIAGCKIAGEIKNCYTYATISGENNVGGITGTASGTITSGVSIKSNVSINSIISASSSNVGRIYGNIGNAVTIGALGSQEGNRALTQTSVMLCGVAQDITDDEQNGTSVGSSMLKLRANYVSWGWNFNDNWDILETESYPYKKYQAAPPVIKSTLQSQDESISGQSLNGGTVYMYYKDRNAVSTECDGYNWTFNTEKLQSGAQVQLYADVEGMTPSYFTSAIVKFPGSGTEEDPYRIYSAEDLQGATNSGYYKLMNNIDLTSWINENSPVKGWQAIGRNSSVATYIDGDGHKVTGLWINNPAEGYNGLFSNYSAGYIKNLNVEVAEGKKVKGGDYTGILIGRMANGEISNCSVKGNVIGTNEVGCLAGYIENSTLTNNSVDGAVSSDCMYANIGGITGHAKNVETTSNTVTASVTGTGNFENVGGLFGWAEGGFVSKCLANVTLETEGCGSYAGGLVGKLNAPVSQSYSTGTVNHTYSQGGDENSYTGGLIGYATANVENCYSTANVVGTQYTAGLVGYTESSIDKCYAKGDVKGVKYGAGLVGELDGANAKVTNSVAANNKIELTDQSAWGCRVVGGFMNGAAEPTFGSNLALATMQVSLNNVPMRKTDDNIEGVAKTERELKCGTTYTDLGWDLIETWGILELNSFPYLQTTKPVSPSEPGEEGGETGGDDTPGSDTADYALSVEGVTTTANSSVNISVNLNNKNDINGFQFDIVLPEGVTIPKTSRGKYIINLGERGDDHTFSSTQRADGSIRVVCTSLSNAVFEGNSGEICVIPLDIDNTLVNGKYTVKLQNIALSDVESTNIQASDASAEITIINDYVTSADTEASVGKTFELPLNLINKSTDICSFQMDVVMPNGISLAKDGRGKYMITLSDRGDDHVFSTLDRENNTVRVVCTSLTNSVFDGNDGALCNLTFTTSADIEDGTYDIAFTNIRLSNTMSVDIPVADTKGSVTLKSFTRGDVNNDGIISVADVTAAISFVLEEPQASFIREAADMDGNGEIMVNDVTAVISLVLMDENVSAKPMRMLAKRNASGDEETSIMYVEPFSIEPGETKDINIMLDNPDLVAIGWQADIYLPEGLSFPLSKRGKLQTAYVDDRTYDYSITSREMSDGSVRVVGVSMDNYEIEGTSGAIMTIKVTASENLEAGVYTANLKNVALSSETSENKPLVNTEYSILSGDLSDLNAMNLPGGWTEDAITDLNEKLQGNTSIAYINMADAIFVANKSVEVGNSNALIYVPAETVIPNSCNVVVGDECENLVLTDGGDFYAPKAFTAVSANYNLAVSASLGYKTLVLPFDWSVPVSHNAYEVTGVSNGELEMSQVYAVNANTPVIVENVGSALINATNVTIAASGAALTCGELIGTYEKMNAPTGSYVLQNQGGEVAFYLVGEEVHPAVGAFRAYLKGSNGGARRFALRPGVATGISNVNAESSNEYYNLAGQRVEKSQRGINIIRSNDGVKKIVAP